MNDRKRTALYVTNGIICDYADYYGRYPAVDDVRANWRMKTLNGSVTDTEIEEIIRLVERQDMGIWN